MSRHQKSKAPLDLLDTAELDRQIDELLRGAEAETERVFASLPPLVGETRAQMHARHREAGRLLQEAGLRFFQEKAAKGRRPVCA